MNLITNEGEQNLDDKTKSTKQNNKNIINIKTNKNLHKISSSKLDLIIEKIESENNIISCETFKTE